MNKLDKELLQVALGVRPQLSRTYTKEEWDACFVFAERQGIVGVLFGGIERLPKDQQPYMDLLMDWVGQVEYMRTEYEAHRKAIGQLALFYREQGIKMLLMKGYGLSLDYPVPEYRPTGDIDIFLVSDGFKFPFDSAQGKRQVSDGTTIKEIADQMVEQHYGIKVEREYHKHSHFSFNGITVENHEKFIDDITHKSNVRFEEILMEQLKRDELVKSPIPNCYLPSATWNALFLLRHAGEHFASNEITLRHVLDLGTFFKAHHEEIDWDKVLSIYKDEQMKSFYDAIATICVRDLGIDASTFCGYTHSDKLADKVLADIFEKKKALPKSMHGVDTRWKKMKYGFQKSLRWYQNRWKYKMVYKESLLESFMGLALNRIKN